MNRTLIIQGIFLLFIVLSLANTGCSSLPTWLGGKKEEPKVQEPQPKVLTDLNGNPLTRYSENPIILETSNRKYRRMTRTRLEEESQLHAGAGSMWVDEGQGSYLFAQNTTRREGDVLNIQIEGAAQKQVETKVSVIKDLLKQLEEQQKKAQLIPLAEGQKTDDPNRAPAATEKPAPKVADKPEKNEPLDIGMIPARITEKLADGNYRVKGQQPFMIGKREYKVIVTGIIRPEDYNDQGMSSNKLLDPQFDVVSIRRSVR